MTVVVPGSCQVCDRCLSVCQQEAGQFQTDLFLSLHSYLKIVGIQIFTGIGITMYFPSNGGKEVGSF